MLDILSYIFIPILIAYFTFIRPAKGKISTSLNLLIGGYLISSVILAYGLTFAFLLYFLFGAIFGNELLYIAAAVLLPSLASQIVVFPIFYLLYLRDKRRK